MVVLPLLLYPLMGMLVFQVQQFLKENPSKIRMIGSVETPDQPRLIDEDKIAAEFGDSNRIELELVPKTSLSRDEIDAITPGATDLATYETLMKVVKEASRKNTAQAELRNRIVALGNTAVTIAKKSAALAATIGL